MSKKLVIVCGGYSLKNFNFNLIPADIEILAINQSFLHLNRADMWFTLDLGNRGNGSLHHEILEDIKAGVRYYVSLPNVIPRTVGQIRYFKTVVPDKTIPPKNGCFKLSENSDEIVTANSGFGSLGLAYNLGYTRIAYLGLDDNNKSGHWYRDDKHRAVEGEKKGITYSRKYESSNVFFEDTVAQLVKKGIKAVNGSPESRVICFPRCTPEKAIEWIKEAQ
ncbi:MAG: hypothetical protein KAS32_18670 [Candidatus Peribacteraceae bacterium]|nr:hypothetical protein [Candidatus Peribacteraceae bacterium]